MKVVLASKNPHKLVEISAILKPLDVELVLESDLGVDVEVEETGSTFEENSFLKANAVRLWRTTLALQWTPWGALPGCIPPGTGTIRPWMTGDGCCSC